MIGPKSLLPQATVQLTSSSRAAQNKSTERQGSPHQRLHQRTPSRGGLNKPQQIQTTNQQKKSTLSSVNTGNTTTTNAASSVINSQKALYNASKKHKFTNAQVIAETPKTATPSTPILNYAKARKSPIKAQTPAIGKKNVQSFNEQMLKFNDQTTNTPQTRQIVQHPNYQQKQTSTDQQLYKSVKNPSMQHQLQKSPGRQGTFSPTKTAGMIANNQRSHKGSNSDIEQLFTRTTNNQDSDNQPINDYFKSPQSRQQMGKYQTTQQPKRLIRNPIEVEELQRQLHGKIQNVQSVIARAEQAQSSRKRSSSNNKRGSGGHASGYKTNTSKEQSSCDYQQQLSLQMGNNSQQKINGGDNGSFKSLNYHDLYQQRIIEMQSIQKLKAQDGSLEVQRQIYDKTPEFRRGTMDQRTTSPVKKGAAYKGANEVVIYSDNEDEDSVLNMLHNAPLQGTLSIIDSSQIPNNQMMEGEAAFNNNLPHAFLDSRYQNLSSQVIAEPLKEYSINKPRQQPPQVLDVITVVEDTVISARNKSDQENRIKPYIPPPHPYTQEDSGKGYINQMHQLEDKLDHLHLQNVDIVAQNHKLTKKNESLNQRVDELKNKKKFYKNQVQNQNQLLKEQMMQLRLMQSEQTSLQAKIENQEAQINRLNAMLNQRVQLM